MVQYFGLMMLIGIFLLLAIAIWLLLRWIKKRKRQAKILKESIPQDILEGFQYLEAEIKNNPNADPYSLMWNKLKGGINGTGKINNRTRTGDIQTNRTIEEPSRVQPLDDDRDGQTKDRNKSSPRRAGRRLGRI